MARGKYSFHSVKFPPILLRWARRTTCVLETPSIPVKRGWHNHGVEHLPDHTLSNGRHEHGAETTGMVVR
ncbi:hypothetical protein TNCV_3688831 [Trichonephila clavipes]|nr:hypothetical protein TNCV_3688831 [Trichonephila clavipes]